MVRMSRTADSNFLSGDIESIQVPGNIATAGSLVVKLYNINDVDTYDMASVTLFSKCRTPDMNLSSQQAMLYTITSKVPDSSTEIICGSTNGCTFGRCVC